MLGLTPGTCHWWSIRHRYTFSGTRWETQEVRGRGQNKLLEEPVRSLLSVTILTGSWVHLWHVKARGACPLIRTATMLWTAIYVQAPWFVSARIFPSFMVTFVKLMQISSLEVMQFGNLRLLYIFCFPLQLKVPDGFRTSRLRFFYYSFLYSQKL